MQNQARTAADGSLVALVDCDTFYASCERVCRPDLEGKPIVVLSNNDGCIVARSREAKKLGIQIGEPEFQFRPSGHDEMTIITLPCPTSDSMTIAGAAEKGLQKIFRPGYGYAKAMVMLTDLSNPAKGQHNMLDLIGNEK